MMVLDLLWNEKRGFETELHEEQTQLLFNHRTTVTAVEFVETPVRTQLDLSSQRCHERKLKKKKVNFFFYSSFVLLPLLFFSKIFQFVKPNILGL